MFQNFSIVLDSLYNANATTSGAGTVESANVDALEAVNASLFLNVAARASGTNTTTVTVQHSEDGSTSWAAVPASALYNADTGAAAAFDDISTTATDQTLALNLQQTRRYIRVQLGGTDIDQNVAITAAYNRMYTKS